MEKKIAVLEILRPQGIKGELKTRPLSDDSVFYSDIKKLYLKNEDEAREITNFWTRDGFIFISLEGVDINFANKLRGQFLYILDSTMKTKMQNDEYLIDDILGFKVVLDNGEDLGILDDVQNFGSADVFYIKNGKKELLFSNVSGVIAEINMDKQTIILNKEKYLEVCCED